MQIHYIYRSTAFENRARRPEYYSKDIALGSFLRSVEACSTSHDVVFVNDGPGMPAPRLAAMEAAGEVIETAGLGNGGSYRYLLAQAETRSWDGDDIVYFAEDDYLYRRCAFSDLERSARTIDRASFFTLYDNPDYDTLPLHRSFERTHRDDRWSIGDLEWRAVRNTTMSFAARVGDLRQQAWMHLLGSNPFLGESPHPADDYIWNASQSFVGKALIPVLFRCVNPRNGVMVNAKRVGLMLREYRSDRRNKLLVAPTVSLATHMHVPFIAPNVDWAAEASAASI
jgi:hypothetical protein